MTDGPDKNGDDIDRSIVDQWLRGPAVATAHHENREPDAMTIEQDTQPLVVDLPLDDTEPDPEPHLESEPEPEPEPELESEPEPEAEPEFEMEEGWGTASEDYAAAAAWSTTSADHPEPDRVSRRSIIGVVALAVLLVAGTAGLGYLIAALIPDRWTAEAEIIFDPDDPQIDRYLATQEVLFQSSAVLDPVIAELPIDRKTVEENLTVFPIEASNALGINFEDEDPELARTVVADLVEVFLTEVNTDQAAISDTSVAIYEQRIRELNLQRQALEASLAPLEAENAVAAADEKALPNPAEVRRLSLESEGLLNRITALEDAVLSAQVAESVRTDTVLVTESRVLPEPSWPKPLAFAAFGALVGAVIAATTLFLLATRRSA